MPEGRGEVLPRTLPGARALGELEVARQADDTLLDTLVAMLEMAESAFAGWLVS